MPKTDRLSTARTLLLCIDSAIALVTPCFYLHAAPAAARALVAAWDAPCLPMLMPAAVAVVWLLAVPVL